MLDFGFRDSGARGPRETANAAPHPVYRANGYDQQKETNRSNKANKKDGYHLGWEEGAALLTVDEETRWPRENQQITRPQYHGQRLLPADAAAATTAASAAI